MSHRAIQRQRHFNVHIEPQPNVTDYMMALAKSPYSTHRRMAKALLPQLESLIDAKQEESAIDNP